MEKRKSHAIRVKFILPVEGKRIYYFGSLKDIFCQFTSEQIGANLAKLWSQHAGRGEKIFTKTCTIERVEIIHYLHKSK